MGSAVNGPGNMHCPCSKHPAGEKRQECTTRRKLLTNAFWTAEVAQGYHKTTKQVLVKFGLWQKNDRMPYSTTSGIWTFYNNKRLRAH